MFVCVCLACDNCTYFACEFFLCHRDLIFILYVKRHRPLVFLVMCVKKCSFIVLNIFIIVINIAAIVVNIIILITVNITIITAIIITIITVINFIFYYW